VIGQDRDAHRDFLNRYYGLARHVYDATRKYYLFGRDEAIERTLAGRWETLVEVGVGTGRNLAKLRARRPWGRVGGRDASDAMLDHARARHGWASFAHGSAEDADLSAVLGERPQRIVFSYSLSMISDPMAALDNARRALAPDGKVIAVDFGDFEGLPGRLGAVFREKWLHVFHVDPLDLAPLREAAESFELGPAHYFFIAEFGPLDD